MKKFIKYGLSLVIASFIISCSSDDDGVLDTVDPVVLMNSPSNMDEFDPGDEINFDISFVDNVALASYKIDIHWAGDGHTHRPSPMHDHDDLIEWDFEVTGNLTGTVDQVQMTVPIPENAKHDLYHVGVIVLDEAGNEGRMFIDIVIGDVDHDHNHNELDIAEFIILDRGHSPHLEILDTHGNHWHGAFSNGITLHATDNEPIPGDSSWYVRGKAEDEPEAVSLGVTARENHGNHTHSVNIPSEYRLEAELTNPDKADVLYITESHGDHVHFVGLSEGHAHIVFKLVRQSDDEVVYTSPSLRFDVHDHHD